MNTNDEPLAFAGTELENITEETKKVDIKVANLPEDAQDTDVLRFNIRGKLDLASVPVTTTAIPSRNHEVIIETPRVKTVGISDLMRADTPSALNSTDDIRWTPQ